MERTEESAAPGPGVETISELAPTAGRRHPARAVAASLTAVALLAAGVGIVAANTDDDSRRPLVLMPGSGPAKESPAVADGSNGGLVSSPYRFRLAIAAPDLGADAPVARLEIPDVDAARVAALAGVLGLEGPVTGTAGDGWQVLDGASVLSVEPTPGGWAVSYGRDTGASDPGSAPGSDGSGGSDGSDVSSDPGAGSSGAVEPLTGAEPATRDPDSKFDPAAPTTPAPPLPEPKPPANLPDSAGAERIARALLERLGVADDSWSARVEETNADDVACAPEPSAVKPTPATARFVVLRPTFASVSIDGLSWHVQIGDNGTVLGVYGTWTELRTIDRYPLRSVDAVFADLVAGNGTSTTPVPMGAIEPDLVAPDYAKPISVTIDRITLGFAVMPASDGGVAVVDLVPTYVFRGTAEGGGEVVQELIAVEATVAPPAAVPDAPVGEKPLPDAPEPTSPPVGKPEPQPMPITGPTVSGTPPT